MANIWRRLPSSRITAQYLYKNRVGGNQYLIADDFFEGSSGVVNYSLTCDVGGYSLSGQDATFSYTAGTTNYSLSCDAGFYVGSGQGVVLSLSRGLVCDAGAYSLQGQVATFSVSHTLSCDAGAYSVSGQDASFSFLQGSVGYLLDCEAGLYETVGQGAELLVTSSTEVLEVSGGSRRDEEEREKWRQYLNTPSWEEPRKVVQQVVTEEGIVELSAQESDTLDLEEIYELVAEVVNQLPKNKVLKVPKQLSMKKVVEDDDEQAILLLLAA